MGLMFEQGVTFCFGGLLYLGLRDLLEMIAF